MCHSKRRELTIRSCKLKDLIKSQNLSQNAWNISFETLYGGQFMLTTQLIMPNYLTILSHWLSSTVSLETFPLYGDAKLNPFMTCSPVFSRASDSWLVFTLFSSHWLLGYFHFFWSAVVITFIGFGFLILNGKAFCLCANHKLLLTRYTLTSVFKFSLLCSIHFLRCWWGELIFSLTIKSFFGWWSFPSFS